MFVLRVYFPLLTVYLSPAQLEALFMFQKALVNTAREHTSKNCLLLLTMSLEIGCVFTHLYKTSFCRANTSSAKVKVWHPSHTHTLLLISPKLSPRPSHQIKAFCLLEFCHDQVSGKGDAFLSLPAPAMSHVSQGWWNLSSFKNCLQVCVDVVSKRKCA